MNLKVRDKNRVKNRLSKESATLVCKGCSKMFTINVGEICWHYEMGNLIPGFCPDCKTKKKELRAQKRKEKSQEITETEEKLVEEY